MTFVFQWGKGNPGSFVIKSFRKSNFTKCFVMILCLDTILSTGWTPLTWHLVMFWQLAREASHNSKGFPLCWGCSWILTECQFPWLPFVKWVQLTFSYDSETHYLHKGSLGIVWSVFLDKPWDAFMEYSTTWHLTMYQTCVAVETETVMSN